MKNLFLTQLFVLICVAGFGQLKVNSDGNVGINCDSSYGTKLRILSPGGGSNGSDGGRFGIYIIAGSGVANGYGIKADCSTSLSSAPAASSCGVMGVAGGFMNGKNYGIVGELAKTQNGSAVFGTVNTFNHPVVSGRYAGYFEGNVKVTGTIDGTLLSSSDVRYKKNIIELESKRTLNSVLKLNPIEYKLEQQYAEDGNGEKVALLDEKSQNFQKKHYGLIAQELKEIYPDLVYEQDNGYLAVNYVELIPILIQSMKEMKAEYDERISLLEKEKSSFRNAETSSNISSDNQTAILYQNTPNPFTQSTEIKYYLPQSVHIAYLCIYDLQGKLLKQINIAQRGEGIETISATEFPAGIYLYGLIADGKEVDMKRMILTK